MIERVDPFQGRVSDRVTPVRGEPFHPQAKYVSEDASIWTQPPVLRSATQPAECGGNYGGNSASIANDIRR